MNENPQGSGDRLRQAATGTTEVAVRQKSIFSFLDDPKVQQKLAVVASKHLRPDRMLSLCVNAVKKTPLLLKCDPRSVLGAMMTATALGLEPNTIQQQAFLIPYRRRMKIGNSWVDAYDCQFQIGARGYITLAYRCPRILSIEAEAVHEKDHFKHMKGSNSFLEYAKTLGNRGPLVGSFSYVKLESKELMCLLPLDEIYKIRGKSEAYTSLLAMVTKETDPKEKAKLQRKFDETPWVMWEDDMAAKSGTKKHAKQLPLSAEESPLAAAAEIDNRNDEGVIDMADMTDPDVVRGVIDDGYEPPQRAEEDDDASGEAYGTTARAEPKPAAQQPIIETLAAASPSPAPEQKQAEDWQPTPAQLAEIRDRERAEAQGQPSPSTPATVTQRRSRPVGDIQ